MQISELMKHFDVDSVNARIIQFVVIVLYNKKSVGI